jgi:hypothetical protein
MENSDQIWMAQTYFWVPSDKAARNLKISLTHNLGYSSQSRNLGTEWKTNESWFYCRQRQGTYLFFEASRSAVGLIKPLMKLATGVIFRGKATGA